MSMWRKTLLYLGLVEEDELEDDMHAYEEPPRESSSTIRKISRDDSRDDSRGGSAVAAPPRTQSSAPKSLGQVHIVERGPTTTPRRSATSCGQRCRSS